VLGILSVVHLDVAATRWGCGCSSTEGLSSSLGSMKSVSYWGCIGNLEGTSLKSMSPWVTSGHPPTTGDTLWRLRAPGGAGRRQRSPYVTKWRLLRQVMFFFVGGRRVIFFLRQQQTAYIFSRQVSPCATRRHHQARPITEVCAWSTIQAANPSEPRRYSMDISKSPELERRAGRQGSAPIKESNEPFRKHRRRRPLR